MKGTTCSILKWITCTILASGLVTAASAQQQPATAQQPPTAQQRPATAQQPATAQEQATAQQRPATAQHQPAAAQQHASARQPATIYPGEVWPDRDGHHIQAHGGGILRSRDLYYWYGEERRQGLDSNYRYVSCYTSKDLVNWTFKGDALQLSDPDSLGRHWVLERPKVYYNAGTKKFVMYMHIDGAVKGMKGGYSYARVGVAVSDRPAGPYTYIRSFRPLGHESRDIGQFVDDDGTAYLVFEDRPYGFRIARLSADYMNVEKEMSLIPQHMEGGAIVHYKGLYYAIGSALTGWAPNPNKYATAPSLEGPWTEFKDIAPPEARTYGAQSTMLLKITGKRSTTVLFMGDIWKPKTQWDSRYLWMPLEIGDGKLWLPEPRPFTLDLRNGTYTLSPAPTPARPPTATPTQSPASIPTQASSQASTSIPAQSPSPAQPPTATQASAQSPSPTRPQAAAPSPTPTEHSITIDLAQINGPLQPLWAFFGYDEPNYTYMKDGKKLLSEIAAISPVPVYVRCHNLLTTGDGVAALKWGSTNAYTEDEKGNPVYDWHIVDSIFDTYVQRGMKPLAEIGFMPEALSAHPHPYRHHWKPGMRYDSIYTGWAYPPTDYKKWGELVYQWVKHSVQRYGEKEVLTWLWEVWNEPNISYWKGAREEYYMLYDYASDAVKRALPSAHVGGPASTGPGNTSAQAYLRNFLAHCAEGKNYATGRQGSPLDFISFHAKGSPKVVDGHVRMNMAPQLKDAANGFEIVSASAYKDLPIYITECDPEGCAACGMATNPENAYRNGTMYSSYTAASFARLYDLADSCKVNLKGLMSWSFEFEDQKWFDGFRDLATNGIDKPVLNVFRMYGLMHGDRLKIENGSDVGALGSTEAHSTAVMVWNYRAADTTGDDAAITLQFKGLPDQKISWQQYRIDKEHSNAYEAWKKMGSPQSVTTEQYRQLEQAGQLQAMTRPQPLETKEGKAELRLSLPVQGISLIRLTY